MPLISQARSSVDGASWEEQTLLGRNRSGSSSSFESLRSPVTPLDAYPFPTVQDLEKAGPIHLGPAYPKSATRSWRQFLLHIRPKVVSILALYVLCASLAILLLLPRHHYGTRSMLHSRAKSSSPLYRDLPVTLGVVPKRIASHNDYEQAVPLYIALAVGATSVEADVWLIDGEVRVGHHKHLTYPKRTLKSLYIDPLLAMLQKANAVPSATVNGVFDLIPDLSLQLLIDFKDDSTELYNAVMADLEPLRLHGLLTTYNGTAIIPSAITVVGSGEARLDLITAQAKRDLFFDVPLDLLSTPGYAHLDACISPMASVNIAHSGYRSVFFWRREPYEKMQEWIEVARARGIAARFWGGPKRWSWLRRRVWSNLVQMGVDWLNSDELEEASLF